jgi:hypothetical protein
MSLRKRHVFSTPSLEVAQAVVDAARANGVGRDCICIEARPDIEVSRIRDDRKNVSMDFVPAALRGTLLGGLAGLAAGLIGMNIPFFGLSGLGAIALMVIGALVGTWASVLIGSALPDEVRRTIAAEIEAGRILVVIDAELEEFDAVERAIAQAGGDRLPYEVNAALT